MSENKGVISGADKHKEHCPLCGGLNQCLSGIPLSCREGPCWCRAETFPAALLAQLPEDERNVRCICQNCLKAFQARLSEP